jgi:hypothetical protein
LEFETIEAVGSDRGSAWTLWAPSLVSINLLCIAREYWWGGSSIAEEHGPMEMIQLALIALSFWYFWGASRERSSAYQTVGSAMTIMAAAVFVRELDVRSLGGPDWYRWLTHHGLQEILMIGMSMPALGYLWMRRQYFASIVRLAFSRTSWPMWAAGVLVAAGVFVDSRAVRWYGPHLRFLEELAEVNGYALLLLAARRHLDLTRAVA